jgi:hypothetical protein
MPKKAQKTAEISTSDEPEVESEKELLLSTSQVAAALRCTRQWVSQLDRAGIIKKTRYGKYPLSAIADATAQMTPSEQDTPTLAAKRGQLLDLQCAKVELALAERRGELQSKVEVEAKLAALVADTRKLMLAVPNRVSGRFGLPRDVIEGIAEEIRDALVELSVMGDPEP